MTNPAAIQSVIDAIKAAESDGPLPHSGSDALGGLSGHKTIGLLQRLAVNAAADPDTCYLEIGVFQGLTLLSVALTAPGLACFGIDDFSILDPEGHNLGIVNRRLSDLGAKNASLINADYEAALHQLDSHIGDRKCGVYFVDGAHDYRSQLLALLLGERFLSEHGVIVIDDANYAYVRRSTQDFLLARPDFKLVFDAYSPAHPANLDAKTLARFEASWLNGIHVLVRDPGNTLPVMTPPLSDDRALYVNDWLVHRHGLAVLAPEALALAAAVCDGDDAAEAEARARLIERKNVNPVPGLAPEFPDRNTYSKGLPEFRLNE